MPKGLYLLHERFIESIYDSDTRCRIENSLDIYAPTQDSEAIKSNLDILKDAEIIMSGWELPLIDAEFLAATPNLKAIFYGAGTVKRFLTDEFWDSGIIITSAWAANAIPVAEYSVSQIIFCLKQGWFQTRKMHKLHSKEGKKCFRVKGAYKTTVGLISIGMIGAHVAKLLKSFDVKVIAYDPFVSAERAAELNIELTTLDDVFKCSDVISLHAPLLDETVGMITGKHFEMMSPGAAFINTARGAIVREDEMIAVLKDRPDIFAVLDVTHPEPPTPDSPLFNMENVALTPHMAGSGGNECARMGQYAADELERYLAGKPLKYALTKETAAKLA